MDMSPDMMGSTEDKAAGICHALFAVILQESECKNSDSALINLRGGHKKLAASDGLMAVLYLIKMAFPKLRNAMTIAIAVVLPGNIAITVQEMKKKKQEMSL